MNGADIIVLAGVAALALLAAAILWRNKKKGKRSCGCQCSGGCGCSCGKSAPPDEPIKKSCR